MAVIWRPFGSSGVRELGDSDEIVLNLQVTPEQVEHNSFIYGGFASVASRNGDSGMAYYYTALRFLDDLRRMKKARPQAGCLMRIWRNLCRTLMFRDPPDDIMPLYRSVFEAMKTAMVDGVWLRQIDDPLKKQLDRAKSRKRTLAVSEKGVKAFEEFRAVFALEGIDYAELDGVDCAAFEEEWCLPKIDECLGYWRDQLAFIEMRIAQEGSDG